MTKPGVQKKKYRFYWRVREYPWGDHEGEVVEETLIDAQKVAAQFMDEIYHHPYPCKLSTVNITKIIEESNV